MAYQTSTGYCPYVKHYEIFYIERVKQDVTDRSWVHFLAEPLQAAIFISI
jgi:hypothetical protein